MKRRAHRLSAATLSLQPGAQSLDDFAMMRLGKDCAKK
jgi:hypothetical protein